MILARANRWCIVGLTNSARRVEPKISCHSTSRPSRWSRLANWRRGRIAMPGTTATPDIELIIENVGGGGGGRPPAGGDGGDVGDFGRRRKGSPDPGGAYPRVAHSR